MAKCTDPKIGSLLFAFELNALSDEDWERFSAHLLQCEYCFNEVKELAHCMKSIRENAFIREITSMHSDIDKKTPSGSWWTKAWKYLWPKSPLLFRPAITYLFILLMAVPACIGFIELILDRSDPDLPWQPNSVSSIETAAPELLKLADSLSQIGMFDQAVSKCSLALVTVRQAIKSCDSLKSQIHSTMGDNFSSLKYYEDAQDCFQKALDIKTVIFGEDNPIIIPELERLGRNAVAMKNNESALHYFERAYKLAEDICGPNSIEMAEGLVGLFYYYRSVYNAEKSRLIAKRAVSCFDALINSGIDPINILDRIGGSNCTSIMTCTDNPGNLFKAVLHSQREKHGPAHVDVARAMIMLGDVHGAQGRYLEKLEMYKQAAGIIERHYGPNHTQTARILMQSADLYRFLTRFEEAENSYIRAVHVYSNIPGFHQTDLVQCFKNLAIICDYQARYKESEAYARKALELIPLARLEESGPHAELLNCLGNIYMHLGRFTQSESSLMESLKIRRDTRGEKNPNLGEVMCSLGNLYRLMGRYDDAESYLRRALAVREAYYGKKHIFLVYNLVALGNLYNTQHRYEEAAVQFMRAREICEAAYHQDHQHFAWIYQGLGDSYRFQGNYAKSEHYYLKAMEINNTIFRTNHSDVIPTITGLAHLYGSMGDYGRSRDYYSRLLVASQNFVDDVFDYTTEDQRLKFVNENPLIIHPLLSLALLSNSQKIVNTAFEMVLKGKAAVADAAAAEKKFAFCSYDEHLNRASEKYAEVCGFVSAISLIAQKAYRPQVYYDSLRNLCRLKDSLEIVLSSCYEFKNELSSRRLTIEDISTALPHNSALCDFVYYEPYDFAETGHDKDRLGAPRYLVFFLKKNDKVKILDLGPARIIDSLVALTRKTIYHDFEILLLSHENDAETRLSEITQQLFQTIFAPFEPYLAGISDIYISPDGQLNLLPFEILHCPDDKYLVEKYCVGYLSSGRDLLRFTDRKESGDLALIIANPDYDLTAKPFASRGDPWGGVHHFQSSILHGQRSSPANLECLDKPFSPLPYTQKAALSILKTLNESPDVTRELLLGGNAREENIKKMQDAPHLLHIATHAYFCPAPAPDTSGTYDNPLLRSGLALAGANRIINNSNAIASGEEDGILTAFEVSGLNLVGTDLVVLSACETGLGDILSGEGVFGFRRAFNQAGSKSLIMSLWRVSDSETCTLMEEFYRRLTRGFGKREALRLATLHVMNICRHRYNTTHPYFWGAFVFSGSPE